eukprot:CAMPEP_0173207818 /NCGR_PEP_ID=MMETSP1141-20130122/22149_1 /TAXON_ID=483371 /ORGANISM="non described non described, Strain CCMP2298" /LENGTH=228 /DNA_ID=CAMNT_0014134155 /DNA_START=217 /DNA_END=900 /DNA_ORIENTATION=+
MLALETQAVHSAQSRQAHQLQLHHEGLLRVISTLRLTLLTETNTLLHTRHHGHRRIVHLRRQAIVSRLQCECDRLSLAREEALSLQSHYHHMLHTHAQMHTAFAQRVGERVASQKEKTLTRLEGFARITVDDMQNPLQRASRAHPLLFMVQAMSVQMAAAGVLPRADQVFLLLNYFDQQEDVGEGAEEASALLLLQSLQLLELLASNSWIAHGLSAAHCLTQQRLLLH